MKATVGQLAQILGGHLTGPADAAALPVGRSVIGTNPAAMQADEALSAGEPIVVWDMTGSSAGSATPAGHANHGLVTSNQDDTEGSSWRIIVDDVAAALRWVCGVPCRRC